MSSVKRYGQQAEKDRSKQYLALGIVIALIVGALILWNNWPKTNNDPAAQIGDETFTVNEVGYFYTQVHNSTWQMAKMYEQFGMASEFNSSLAPADQIYDEASGKTYADYFRETALSQLQEMAILIDQANKEGYSLSKEGSDSVTSQLASIDSQILQLMVQNGGSESYYLKAMYGETMTKSLLKQIITDKTLASEYEKQRAEKFTYDDTVLNSYYEQHSADLDSYDYRMFRITADLESTVDEEGKSVEPSDEQVAAAMDKARTTAQAMSAKLKRGADFNTLAQEYASEDEKANYADPNATLTIDALGSSLASPYGDWLKDPSRRSTQVGLIEQDGSAVYVLQFIAREKRENSFETVDIGSILVSSDTTESTDEEGNTTTAATQEQLDAAKAKAEELLAQWTAAPDKTPETFLALAPAGDSSISAETLTQVLRSTYGADFDQWAFTPASAQLGDTAIVEVTDANNAVIGYRLVNLTAFGQPRWLNAAETALRNADYSLWFENLKAEYPITELEGLKQVGTAAS